VNDAIKQNTEEIKMSESLKLPKISEEVIKYIAAAAMVCDHLALVLYGSYYSMPLFILHMIGRIAMPVFSWFIVEGSYRTRDINRYMSRMLFFAAISYIPFALIFAGRDINANWVCFNQLFSFFFGLLFLSALHGNEKMSSRILTGVIAAVGILFCQYGLFGLGVIIAFDIMHHNKKYGILAYTAVIFTFAHKTITGRFSSNFNPDNLAASIYTFDFVARFCVDFLGYFLPLIFILLMKPSEKRPGKFSKWFFYIFYPLHLLLLALYKYRMLFMPGMPETN
jgi:hypothetical protein